MGCEKIRFLESGHEYLRVEREIKMQTCRSRFGCADDNEIRQSALLLRFGDGAHHVRDSLLLFLKQKGMLCPLVASRFVLYLSFDLESAADNSSRLAFLS